MRPRGKLRDLPWVTQVSVGDGIFIPLLFTASCVRFLRTSLDLELALHLLRGVSDVFLVEA